MVTGRVLVTLIVALNNRHVIGIAMSLNPIHSDWTSLRYNSLHATLPSMALAAQYSRATLRPQINLESHIARKRAIPTAGSLILGPGLLTNSHAQSHAIKWGLSKRHLAAQPII